MEDYIKLLNRLQQEQRELYILKEQKSKFAFIARSQINNLIKQYDDAILYHLRVMEKVMNEEYQFLPKWKKVEV